MTALWFEWSGDKDERFRRAIRKYTYDSRKRVCIASRESLKRVRESRYKTPGFSRDIWLEMAENGWIGLALPEALGGVVLELLSIVLYRRCWGLR